MDCCAVFTGDDVVFGEGHQVADSASDIALEDEDVAGEVEFFDVAEVGFIEDVTFFSGEVERGAVFLRADGEFAEWVVFGVAHIYAPAPIGHNCAHIGYECIVAAFLRSAFVWGIFPDIFVFLDGFEDGAVFFFDGLEELVFVAEEVFKVGKGVGRGFVDVDGLAGVEFVSSDEVEDDVVAFVPLV